MRGFRSGASASSPPPETKKKEICPSTIPRLSCPDSISTREVFPAPLGPRIASISPAATRPEIPDRIVLYPASSPSEAEMEDELLFFSKSEAHVPDLNGTCKEMFVQRNPAAGLVFPSLSNP